MLVCTLCDGLGGYSFISWWLEQLLTWFTFILLGVCFVWVEWSLERSVFTYFSGCCSGTGADLKIELIFTSSALSHTDVFGACGEGV